MIHRGKIVEKVIRESGYNLTKLAGRLGISRNTFYNKFNDPNVSYRFIMELGNIIHYDFTIDFPEMKNLQENVNPISGKEGMHAPLSRLEVKYTHLLEKYTKLLETLISITNGNRLLPKPSSLAP